MFKNTYQNGPFFDLFNPKSKDCCNQAPPEKTKGLYQIQHVHNNIKVEDKQTKSPIFIFAHPNSKICFPKDQGKNLGLTQQFLTIQIFIIPGLPWSIQLGISDQNKIKRRIIFSHENKKTEIKAFYIKHPCMEISEGNWISLTVDLYSFMNAFPETIYRALDSIQIRGFFKLRRIYTSKTSVSQLKQNIIDQENQIPKNFKFPRQLNHQHCIIVYKSNKQQDKSLLGSRLKLSTCKKGNQELKLPKINSKSVEKHIYKRRYLHENFPLQSNLKLRLNEINGFTNNNISQQNKLIKKLHPICKSELFDKVNPKKFNISLRKLRTNKQNLTHQKNFNNQITNQCSENNEQNRINISKFMEKNAKDIKTQRTSTTAETKFPEQKQSCILSNSSNIQSNLNCIKKSYKLSSIGDSGVENANYQIDNQQIQQDIQQQSSIIFNQEEGRQLKVQRRDKVPQRHRRLSKSEAQLQFQVSKIKALDPRNLKKDSYEGFGQKVIHDCLQQIQRPYSPPLLNFQAIQSPQNSLILPEHKQLELIFDPVLEHYYDCKTKTYYELKNK